MKNFERNLVSVIIPFYNRFSLVEEALRMLSCQKYKNFEVVLVDDGSDDQFEIENIKSLFEFTIVYIKLERNSGPGAARRIGRELAKGKFIAYLDSDDWWSDNFLLECVKALNADKTLGMAFSNTIRIDHGKEVSHRIEDTIPTSIIPFIFQKPKRLWSTPSCLWHSNVSKPCHWVNLRNHEDYVHDIKSATINNNIVFVEEALTYNNHSAPNRIERSNLDVKKALNIILSIQNLPDSKGISSFYLRKLYENSIRISYKELIQNFNLSNREFINFSHKNNLFKISLILNFLGFRTYFQKKIIKRIEL